MQTKFILFVLAACVFMTHAKPVKRSTLGEKSEVFEAFPTIYSHKVVKPDVKKIIADAKEKINQSIENSSYDCTF